MDIFTTCDLLESSKQHIRFLEEIHKTGISLRSPTQLQKSFDRYVNYWLPLVKNIGTTKLIPPADVAWLWHCHRLAPQEYEKFIEKEYGPGVVIESTSPFSFLTPESYGKDEMITRSIWKQYYPIEPFFLLEEEQGEQAPISEPELVQQCKERLGGYCIFASAQGQRTFLWQISEPWYLEDEFLQDGVDRYYKFLQLARVMDKTSLPLVPTFQIDLLWHTHILLSNQQYKNDCLNICGRTFRHDDSFNDRSEGGDLEQAFIKTCKLWKQQYGTDDYCVNGAMYRGEPPEEYFTEYDTWDGSEWTVEYHDTMLSSPLIIQRLFHTSSIIGAATRKLDPRRLLSQIKKKTEKGKQKNQPSAHTITWNDLLMATGKDIWELRKQVYVQSTEEKADHVRMPIYRRNKNNNKTRPGPLLSLLSRRRRNHNNNNNNDILVVGNFDKFQQMEANGMEKRKSPPTSPKSLTQEVGEEWKRQRELIAKRALLAVKEMSLKAVDQVNWDDILQRHHDQTEQRSNKAVVVVDLKAMVVEACLDWMILLFGGCASTMTTKPADDGVYNHAPLAKAFLDLWTEIRAKQKNSVLLKATEAKLVDAIIEVAQNGESSGQGGIIHHIFRQKLSTEQAAMNCVNAMVAAFDAAVVVVFWTLWNLARTEGAWEKCRNELLLNRQKQRGDDSSDTASDPDELEELAALKKSATEGVSYDCSHLSYLSRAMAETLRVFPPVWTLPRVEETEDGQSYYVQLDVAWTNHALDYRGWDPDRTNWLPLATFGVGKRHCPGGTAALFATRRLLRRFVEKYETIVECEDEHAIRSLYLGPTLSMEGAQYFELSLQEQEGRKGSKI